MPWRSAGAGDGTVGAIPPKTIVLLGSTRECPGAHEAPPATRAALSWNGLTAWNRWNCTMAEVSAMPRLVASPVAAHSHSLAPLCPYLPHAVGPVLRQEGQCRDASLAHSQGGRRVDSILGETEYLETTGDGQRPDLDARRPLPRSVLVCLVCRRMRWLWHL